MKKAIHLLASLATLAGVVTAVHAQGAASAPAPPGGVARQPADKLIAMCIGCHNIPGYQASFPEVHKVPMIAGQNAKYIAAALAAYKKGDRKHPTMRGIATSLTEQDMADIGAYYEQLGRNDGNGSAPDTPPAPDAEVQALITKGACASCHGANFSKPIDPSYPKLAGQHPDYLYVALKAYQTENNVHVGRSNAIMAAQVKPFTHPELKAIAQYLGSLPGELKTVPQSRFR